MNVTDLRLILLDLITYMVPRSILGFHVFWNLQYLLSKFILMCWVTNMLFWSSSGDTFEWRVRSNLKWSYWEQSFTSIVVSLLNTCNQQQHQNCDPVPQISCKVDPWPITLTITFWHVSQNHFYQLYERFVIQGHNYVLFYYWIVI